MNSITCKEASNVGCDSNFELIRSCDTSVDGNPGIWHHFKQSTRHHVNKKKRKIRNEVEMGNEFIKCISLFIMHVTYFPQNM